MQYKALLLFSMLMTPCLAQEVNIMIPTPQVSLSTVVNLPACAAALEGQIRGVTNALTPVALASVAGGGAVHVLVYCTGSAWIVL